ncbi:hypothetical protein TVAG_430650 [Trichomonas vaginalis G3]|uniref:Uncharacterized protein n=1 Tax=Trichomonas vaginalis (strain ATCC PRA-98 / G3) TaxID=412133 RepID=A2E390_TRIV3|nr:hypothetical protein TVAGG3_1017730 [Trichomonas vaginalis G3]EAY12900.1 hypothetical protein TVAG_430650 [Trichomonas vaginalis G3]KAI5491929.1 hypothetical protein TVAGG3_1017730 [Trichomonas vaginalis G3]|eukprot:XP_001325123.1 hypothetical protein [Trichomonas vaginalis G3]
MNDLKELWTPKLLNAGYSIENIQAMDSSEFFTTCHILIQSGLEPPLPPPCREKLDKKTRVALQCALFSLHSLMVDKRTQKLEENRRKHKEKPQESEQTVQDKKYDEILQQTQKDQEKESNKEEEKRNQEQNRRNAIEQEYQKLGPEPEDGFLIKIQYNQNSSKRKFTAEQQTDDIYAWAAHEFMILGNFTLMFVSTKIQKGSTLNDAEITKNTMLSVVIDSEEEEEN